MKKDDSNFEMNEQDYKEPPLEAFLMEEEETEKDVKRKHNHRLLGKGIAFLLIFALLSGVFGIWVNLYNLPSFHFLEKSKQLSQEEIVQHLKESIVTVEGNGVKGTGFNISSKGIIITNYHVVENMNNIVISFLNREFYKATIVIEDEDLDFAVLRIDDEVQHLPYLKLADLHSWKVGDRVFIIGNPLAHTRIVIEGEILQSSENEILRIEAPIHKGNSGSPVLNQDGKVIGMIYAKTIPRVGQNEQIVGLATPLEKFYHYIEINK